MANSNQSPQILLYHSMLTEAPPSFSVVNSPIACLGEATQKSFELVAISFQDVAIKEREALVELCSVLRKHTRSAEFPLLALIPCRHRELLAGLKDAGVEHVLLLTSVGSRWPAALQLFAENRMGAASTAQMLEEICPYINYVPISRRREMLYCRAYRNRLVLGPYLLNAYCETSGHGSCPYYLQPQFAGRFPGGTSRKTRIG